MPARMNDLSWVVKLARAKPAVRYTFQSIHVCAQLRGSDGIAPVVLSTSIGYVRAPIALEAAYEVILRHLHGSDTRWPVDRSITASVLLADRATAALLLPGRYIPTLAGEVVDLMDQAESLQPAQPRKPDVVDPVKMDANLVTTPDIILEDAELASIDGVGGADDCDSMCAGPPSVDFDELQPPIPSPDTNRITPPVQASVAEDNCADSQRPSTKKERRLSAQQARRRRC